MVIAIIGILVALLLPAVQAAREAARRSSCQNNLAQLILAVQNYESAHRTYPPGTVNATGPIINLPRGFHHNWIIQVLPFIQEQNAYRLIDHTVSVYHPKNAPVRAYSFAVRTCPSEPAAWTAVATTTGVNVAPSNYAGVHHDVEAPIDVDNNGVFFLNSRVRYDDVTDGTSHTLFIGEKLIEQGNLGWVSGTRSTLRNTGTAPNATVNRGVAGGPASPFDLPEDVERLDEADLLEELAGGGAPGEDDPTAARSRAARAAGAATAVGGFGSYHPGGAQFACGDGRVSFISETIDLSTYQQLGHRADGMLNNYPY